MHIYCVLYTHLYSCQTCVIVLVGRTFLINKFTDTLCCMKYGSHGVPEAMVEHVLFVGSWVRWPT